MRQRLQTLIADFPRQFWILFGGTLVNSTGNGLVFPFLTLYLHQRLNLSMTYVGMILMFWSISSLVGQIVGGMLADRLGRKLLMASSLGASACVMALFGFADSFATASIVVMLCRLCRRAVPTRARRDDRRFDSDPINVRKHMVCCASSPTSASRLVRQSADFSRRALTSSLSSATHRRRFYSV